MSDWKYCKEYGFWVNFDKFDYIRIDVLDEAHDTHNVVAILPDKKELILFTSMTRARAREWIKEMVNA